MSVLDQQISSGFKQTDVGVTPEDWDVAPLFEVCGFGGGTTPPRSQHDRYFVGGSNNWIKTTDLNNSLIGLSEEQITDVALSETGLKKHPVGTVLVAMYGGFNQIGRTGLITKPSTINQALVAVKPKPKKLNSYYLLSELNYNVDYWKGVASSSRKDPNITSNDVKNYKIALPSVEEQTAIANALSDVDALLTELEKLIAKKQAIKTATMQQLLTGKTRLPQFATYTEGAVEGKSQGQLKGTKPSELGEIPEDWDVDLLKDISSMRGRIGWQGLKQEEFTFNDQQPFLITGMNFKDGKIRWNEVYHIPEDRYEMDRNIQLKVGDILMTKDGTIGKLLFVDHIPKPHKATLNSHLLLFRPKLESYVPKYLYYLMKTRLLDDHIELHKSGSTFFGITQEAMGKLLVPLPSNEEQTAIATILSDMDNEIQTLDQRLAKTRQIKQGMMQELLTGRTRLPFDKEQ
tara:strand:- start:9701 stop:11080 length:1380 start_codon:yes stop_codon:yes gene_type:complete